MSHSRERPAVAITSSKHCCGQPLLCRLYDLQDVVGSSEKPDYCAVLTGDDRLFKRGDILEHTWHCSEALNVLRHWRYFSKWENHIQGWKTVHNEHQGVLKRDLEICNCILMPDRTPKRPRLPLAVASSGAGRDSILLLVLFSRRTRLDCNCHFLIIYISNESTQLESSELSSCLVLFVSCPLPRGTHLGEALPALIRLRLTPLAPSQDITCA